MRLKNIILVNRAPFGTLRLNISDDPIIIFSGINGSGKTTLMSYIVDAVYELAKKGYPNEFENVANKYYRVSSVFCSVDSTKDSIVYLRFINDKGENIDYVDYRGTTDGMAYYDNEINLLDKIPFSSIKPLIEKSAVCKLWSIKDNQTIQDVFDSSLLTYFPAYRYEEPFYLNDPYHVKLSFQTEMSFSGYLPNPIEVTSDLPNITNWIMDVVLDSELYKIDSVIIKQINSIITNILYSKVGKQTRLGIGPRNFGANRIAVMTAEANSKQLYPSLFGMSSGELSLLCIFVELIKQADKIGKTLKDVSGIVLVDEIDKHLHIRLQKDTIPRLLAMFPHIQFVLTSHSPFLCVGVSESELSHSIIDLDKGGVKCSSQDNLQFKEAYDFMINQNEQYYSRYNDLLKKIDKDKVNLVITEGKTDWKHIKSAMINLEINNLDIEFYEYEDTIGDTKLKQLLEHLSMIPQSRKIIGIFDRDNFGGLKWDGLDSSDYVSLGNNVYAFAIPLVNKEEYGEEISIEHYYKRVDLTRADSNGRRIFLGDEFYDTGNSKDGRYFTRCSGIDKKIHVCGVVDDRVYSSVDDLEGKKSVALSKNDFATLILNGDTYSEGFDYSNFKAIFNVINKIIDIKDYAGN